MKSIITLQIAYILLQYFKYRLYVIIIFRNILYKMINI